MLTPRIDPNLVTLNYLARRMGLPMPFLRQLADSGQIPALRKGNTYLVDADAVQAALAELARNQSNPTGGGQP